MAKLSKYMRKLAKLEATMCPKCKGHAIYDDADFGDTCFRTYHCELCKRTGMVQGESNGKT